MRIPKAIIPGILLTLLLFMVSNIIFPVKTPEVQIDKKSETVEPNSNRVEKPWKEEVPEVPLKVSESSRPSIVSSVPLALDPNRCSSAPKFDRKRYDELRKESPESLFLLLPLRDLGFDSMHRSWHYKGEIAPLPEFQCDCPTVSPFKEVCSGMSFFEIVISGPAMMGAEAVYDPSLKRYTFDIFLPLTGQYTAEVKIIFMDFQKMFDTYSRRQFSIDVKEEAFRSMFPEYIARVIVDGSREISLETMKSLDKPTCSMEFFQDYNPGYWEPTFRTWTPLRCNLGISKLSMEIARSTIDGLWITFLGDSNTRAIFNYFCDVLRGEARNNGKHFVCLGENFAMTEHIYWYSMIQADTFLYATLEEDTAKACEGGDPLILNDFHLSKKEPDLVFLSLGTHSQDLVGDFMANNVLNVLKNKKGDLLAKQKIAIMMTMAVSVSFLPNFPDTGGLEWMLNNPRIKSVNDGTKQVFFDHCRVFDFYSPTLPLSLNKKGIDPGLFRQPHYLNFVRMILSYITEFRKTAV